MSHLYTNSPHFRVALCRHEEVLQYHLNVIAPRCTVCFCGGDLCTQICSLFVEI